jgi:hypothetical protein
VSTYLQKPTRIFSLELQKKRGKRPPPDSAGSITEENPQAKKPKFDKPMSASLIAQAAFYPTSMVFAAEYEKEVKNYAGRNLKDDGMGVRALVK